VLLVREGTNSYKAVRYMEPLINRMQYGWWHSGIIPDGPPAYAVNKPAPDNDNLKGKKVFCAGVANLMLRRVGKKIPTLGNADFDGGTGAYWGGSFGRAYYANEMVGFSVKRAKNWARDTRKCVLIGRRYRNSNHDQGHVAILLPSGFVLQSFPSGGTLEPGLNWDYTIEQSHQGGYYEFMVHPSEFLD
jgi:hypothetical protein